jgi:hypothetical protein
MKIEWASSAHENLKMIHSEVELISTDAAMTVLNRVLKEVDRLASSRTPAGRDESGTQEEFPLVSVPIVVPYRISGDAYKSLRFFRERA